MACERPNVSNEIPSTDEEWKTYIDKVTAQLPERLVSQEAIPLGINRMIDHTLLQKDVDPSRIDNLCQEAKEHGFASVCVRPEHVSRAAASLKDTPHIKVASVVGFHEGTFPTEHKVQEAKEAVANGAGELDMVINWPLLKQQKYTGVYRDILAVRQACPPPVALKAIIETSQLDKQEVMAATLVACRAEVDWVKTSTGFNGPGARVDDISFMNLIASLYGIRHCQIKASGGIKNAYQCVRMIKAGARRIGTSAGVAIAHEVEEGEVLEQGAGHATL